MQLTGQLGQGTVEAGETDEDNDDVAADTAFPAEVVAADFCTDKRLKSPGHNRNWLQG